MAQTFPHRGKIEKIEALVDIANQKWQNFGLYRAKLQKEGQNRPSPP